MGKATKAIKVTDKRGEKPWLKKIESVYNIETKNKRKTFLIVCEGQTEEQYFRAFPVVTATIKLVPLGTSTKMRLVECTEALCENETYDEVWCVFDMDYDGDKDGEIEEFNTAIRRCADLSFKCAYSNDAFELWFVLHYQYLEQQHRRKKFYELLSKYWDMNYERHGKVKAFSKSIYNRLQEDKQSNQEKAIAHAEKLFNQHRSKPYHHQNPVTLVYQLVTELNKYLRK
ncbi:RloB domain-containing protein [Chitinophaga agrisoli]|uniref:RloB domain-containing protein n=1 Tax=Chitinophaga agrisoli TaxID=2607653 RepID=A0A5B2VKV1_9BACT|nr:RloB family protein [Chitinophaga agrisoli]KAA2239721.1 RloB domain-containing protein [Chitinophaga agrisoli]